MILDELICYLDQLLSGYEEERSNIRRCLGGDLLESYEQLIAETVLQTEEVKHHLLEIREMCP